MRIYPLTWHVVCVANKRQAVKARYYGLYVFGCH